jgi:hypothetical protein
MPSITIDGKEVITTDVISSDDLTVANAITAPGMTQASGDITFTATGANNEVRIVNDGPDAASTMACRVETLTKQTTATQMIFEVFNGSTKLIEAGRSSGFDAVIAGGVALFNGSVFSPVSTAEMGTYQADSAAQSFITPNNITLRCVSNETDGATALAFQYLANNQISTSGGSFAQWYNGGANKIMELTKDGELDLTKAAGALWVNGTKVVGAQQSSTGETTGFTAGVGTGVNDGSTFTGNTGTKAYTIGDIVKHLKTHGLLASS